VSGEGKKDESGGPVFADDDDVREARESTDGSAHDHTNLADVVSQAPIVIFQAMSSASSAPAAAAPVVAVGDIGWSYADKKILAPMVRVGHLPFRLLCVRNGAGTRCPHALTNANAD
jgi:hypothetical protein